MSVNLKLTLAAPRLRYVQQRHSRVNGYYPRDQNHVCECRVRKRYFRVASIYISGEYTSHRGGNIKRRFSMFPTNADNGGGEIFIETKMEKEKIKIQASELFRETSRGPTESMSISARR